MANKSKSCTFFTSQFGKKCFLFETEIPTQLAEAEIGKYQYVYIGYRAIWTLWWMILFIYDVCTDRQRHTYPIYLTNWSYIGLGVSSALQLACAIHRTRFDKEGMNSGKTPLLYKFNWAFYSIFSPSAILVSIVYWALLYDGDGVRFLDVATHLINTIYVLVDIFVTAIPYRILHVWLSTSYGIIYLIFTLMYWGASSDAVYPIVDFEKNPGSAAMYSIVLILISQPLVHFLLFFPYWLRIVIYGRIFGIKDDKVSPHETTTNDTHDKYGKENAAYTV